MYYFTLIYLIIYRLDVSLTIVLFFIDSAFLMNFVAKERTVNNTINNAVNSNVNNTVNKNNNIEPEAELEDANETPDKNNAGKMHFIFV